MFKKKSALQSIPAHFVVPLHVSTVDTAAVSRKHKGNRLLIFSAMKFRRS